MLKNQNIAIIGAGNIAEALVSGLLKGKVVRPSQIFATDVSEQRLQHFKSSYGVRIGSNNAEAAKWADIVILSIKPQVLDEVVAGFKFAARSKPFIISVAAGVPIAKIQAGLQAKAHIIRVMPNTPSIVLEGATALAGGAGVSPQQMDMAKAIFEAVGKVVVEGLHGSRKRDLPGFDQQMHVITHQDKRITPETIPLAIAFKAYEIRGIIRLVMKEGHAAVATDNNVIEGTREFHTRFSSHSQKIQ